MTQIPAGYFASPSRVGGKRILEIGVLVWSLFTMLTPLSARQGLSALVVCRVAMGLAGKYRNPLRHSNGGTCELSLALMQT